MKADLIERLVALPAVIEAAERHRVAREALQQVEDELLLDPERITGKNAEQRAAQLRAWTGDERVRLTTAEYAVNEAKILLRFRTNELWALKDVARLIAASDV